MIDDLGYALVAGMLATVNPCGFAMLPGYLAFVVAGQEGSGRAVRLGRAVLASLLMTAGFVLVFGAFGLAGASLLNLAQRYLPVVTVVIGVALLVLGALLLAGKQPTLLLPKPTTGAPTQRVVSMFGYGVAFAIASLSCTIGPFLVAAGFALRAGDFGTGFATFIAYALGMGLVVTTLAVGAALASSAVAGGLRRMLPYVGRIGGALLVLTGAYVGYYGYYELRLAHGDGDAADPIVDAAGTVQNAMLTWLERVGPWPVVITLAVLVAGGVLLARRRAARAASEKEGDHPPSHSRTS